MASPDADNTHIFSGITMQAPPLPTSPRLLGLDPAVTQRIPTRIHPRVNLYGIVGKGQAENTRSHLTAGERLIQKTRRGSPRAGGQRKRGRAVRVPHRLWIQNTITFPQGQHKIERNYRKKTEKSGLPPSKHFKPDWYASECRVVCRPIPAARLPAPFDERRKKPRRDSLDRRPANENRRNK